MCFTIKDFSFMVAPSLGCHGPAWSRRYTWRNIIALKPILNWSVSRAGFADCSEVRPQTGAQRLMFCWVKLRLHIILQDADEWPLLGITVLLVCLYRVKRQGLYFFTCPFVNIIVLGQKTLLAEIKMRILVYSLDMRINDVDMGQTSIRGLAGS